MRIAIVEDDPFLRENLKLLLSGEKDVAVVGAYGSGEDALAKLKSAIPEVMLVDLGLPGMSGVELIRRIKLETPDVAIMTFTVFEDRDSIFSAIKAGASGYVLKGSTPRELVEALTELYRGGAPLSPRIARALIQEFQSDLYDEQYLLTPREKEIIKSVEKGMTYKEISSASHISPHTVHTHIKNIYEKLQAKDRREAINRARQKGLI